MKELVLFSVFVLLAAVDLLAASGFRERGFKIGEFLGYLVAVVLTAFAGSVWAILNG